jgi:hypothetical protein
VVGTPETVTPRPYAHIVRSADLLAARQVAPLDLADLELAVRRAWGADTSASATWSADCPSAGQCAVTALVVQDYLGGDLLRAVVCGESHYWNRLPSLLELDLTADQFATYQVDGSMAVRSRDYVLGFPETRQRYELLRSRVASRL